MLEAPEILISYVNPEEVLLKALIRIKFSHRKTATRQDSFLKSISG